MWNIFIALSGAWLVSSVEYPYQSQEDFSVGDNISPPFRFHQTDMETMVDLTNNLGVAILKDHGHSKGNFAFSPYGVASVLVVLYEGARGESAVQIQRAFGFPWNKDSIRVGFRDIHRHLRSYFSHEGYLSGISLNKDKSSLKPEFKKILRIYGYDVELDDESLNDLASQDGSSSPGNGTTTVHTSPPSITAHQDIETTTEEQGTTESNFEQANETTIPPTTTNSEEHTSNSSVTTAEQFSSRTLTITTEQNSNKSLTTTTTAEELKTTIQVPTTTTATTSATTITTATTPVTTTTTEKQNPNPETTTPKEENSTQSESTIEVILLEYTTRPPEQAVEETVPTTTPEPSDNIIVNVKDKLHITLTIDTDCRKRGKRTGEDSNCSTEDGEENTTTLTTNTNHQKTTLVNDEIAKLDNKMLIPQADDPLKLSPGGSTWTQTSSRKSRGVRSVASAVGAKSAIEMSGISKREIANIRKILNQRMHLWTSSEPRSGKVRRIRTITDYLKQAQTGELSLQLQNGMYDSHVSRNEEVYQNLPRRFFLIDGVMDIPVPMMSYTYIFPYAYLPKLRAKAIEFPLDDTRYKLLMLLPIDRRGLRQLIYDLMGYPLRYVLDSMRPAKVKATIPTFMVEGFVILTSSLKKLGIRDVFDPRKANLSGMSVDPELYVRNVEQSVTVVIRNYVEVLDIETRKLVQASDPENLPLWQICPAVGPAFSSKPNCTMAARYIDYDFEATHPFLYFVLDTATNVALMAGQMLDPLNSRIY